MCQDAFRFEPRLSVALFMRKSLRFERMDARGRMWGSSQTMWCLKPEGPWATRCAADAGEDPRPPCPVRLGHPLGPQRAHAGGRPGVARRCIGWLTPRGLRDKMTAYASTFLEYAQAHFAGVAHTVSSCMRAARTRYKTLWRTHPNDTVARQAGSHGWRCSNQQHAWGDHKDMNMCFALTLRPGDQCR